MRNIYFEISKLIDYELTEGEVRELCQNQPKHDCWLFEYIAHVPESRIVNFDFIEEMEQYLIGESSILNAFTTYAVAVVHGVVCEFEIVRNEGSKIVAFSKVEQLKSRSPFAIENYLWHVRWSHA
jgi:hypothetical protein